MKTKGVLMREAQTAFNAYVRWRDRQLYGKCISCNSHLSFEHFGGKCDAGHYLSRGSSAGHKLRFHLWNTHAQCVKCNRFKNGAVGDYRVGLIWRIGHDKVEHLERGEHDVEYTAEYLRRIKKIFTKKLSRRLKNTK